MIAGEEVVKVDITPYLGFIATIALAFVGFYGMVSSRLASLEAKHEAESRALRESIDTLREEVSKHNSVIERTYKLESDVATAFKRIDDLKEADIRLDEKKVDK